MSTATPVPVPDDVLEVHVVARPRLEPVEPHAAKAVQPAVGATTAEPERGRFQRGIEELAGRRDRRGERLVVADDACEVDLRGRKERADEVRRAGHRWGASLTP